MERNDILYGSISGEMSMGRRSVLRTELKSSSAPDKRLYFESELLSPEAEGDRAGALARAAFKNGHVFAEFDENGGALIAEPWFPESRLILLGSGHIAKPLSEFGSKCGFSVTVVDDRPAFANEERFPDAAGVICEGFDRCIPLLNINKSAFVVIITRGNRHDIECLLQMIDMETAYVGMIGSHRRVKAVFDHLIDEGVPEEKLNLICSPIGLDINALTPEEISISILAQLISYKRRVRDQLAGTRPRGTRGALPE